MSTPAAHRQRDQHPEALGARHRPRPGARRHRGRHVRRPGADPVPTGAERLPAHRPRQGDLRRLRHRRRVRRDLQPALRRHQPRHRRHRVRRVDHRRSHLARFPAGQAAVRVRLLRAALRCGPSISSTRASPTSTTRTARPSRRSAAATASRASRARTAIGPIDENLDLFRRMRAGEFADGAQVLRAKIDMQHENMQLRDPVMYRIRRGHHWRTGDEWVIYPTYDWAHGQSDAIEGVTHSLCTLEFDSHRALYDWYLSHLPLPGDQPRQTEFARLELTHTITSKRRLRTLVPTAWSTAGTIRACRRCAACAAAATRPRPSARSADYIGVARTNSRHSHRVARVVHPPAAQRDVAAPDGRAATAEAGDHQLARRRRRQPGRRVPRGRQQPGEPRRRRALGAVLRRSCTSSRTTSWRTPPPKYFRLTPGREVRLAVRVPRDVHRLREGRRRQRRRGALHLRPGDLRRQCSRRPQGEVDDALGLGRSRRRRNRGAVRPAVLGRGSRARRPAIRSTISTPTRASC